MFKYILKQQSGFEHKQYHPKNENDMPDLEKYLEVEKGICIKLNQHKLMWQNGSIIENPNYEKYIKEQQQLEKQKHEKIEIQKIINVKKKRISELKNLLIESDYRAIKYFEGYYTKEEYNPYKIERQNYRNEINQLEEEILNLIK